MDKAPRRPARKALAEHDQAAIEIDLSKGAASTLGELGQLLFAADVRKSRLYNRREQALRETLLAELKRKADEQWLEHRQVPRDLSMQRERERNELVQRHAANRSNDEGHLIQGLVVADAFDLSTQSPPVLRKPQREEGSPAIEYVTPEGRIWLLHSTHPDIHFTADSGVRAALRVLLRHGAVEMDIAGRYTIAPEGWSAACVELAGSWLSVRSGAGVASTEVEGSDSVQGRPQSDGAP